ncbi:hypothetical protein K6119_10900 [Paracrocinitomix mangrovi]|uniref:hypothetical protein n=1 Tax=Paracrocinitomix mangrovi TaxID=2862509 RepID=UPI001C8D4FB6|nr:hypothetical protein [Paracrocinitomix mangrovi]UKN00241.1 hypothetical protein K6119_10900 [Paracrocinitomix mangrovi]
MKYNLVVQRVFCWLMIVGVISSCSQNNFINYAPANLKQDKQKMDINLGDYVVVHVGDESWRLVDIETDKKQISGRLTAVDEDLETFYNKALQDNANLEKANEGDKEFTEQTHIYLHDFAQRDGDMVTFGADNIDDANAVVKNSKGNGLRIFYGVLIVLGALVVGFGILLLIVCSCPHAYTFDGENYHYTNSLFTGAVGPNLERNDYKLIPDYRPNVDSYQMILKNEENEAHFTNMVEMIVVKHDKNFEVIPDQNGKIYTVSDLQKAKSAFDENNIDVSDKVSYRDESAYSFDHQSEGDMVNTYFTFDRPEDVSNAKIVINAKNTEWGGVVVRTFAAMLGKKYNNWVEKNRKRTTEEALADMKEAGIPMVVSIKKDGEWVDLDAINLVGDISYNSVVVSVDENLITGEDIELRLQAGFKFWDLDYVGMDFTAQEDFEVQTYAPTVASGDKDYLAALKADDDLYMENPNRGDSTFVKFEGLPTDGNRTLILRSKGHYVSNEVFEGKPNWAGLMKLRAPGGLSKLSRELFEEVMEYYAVQPAVE